MLIVAFDYDGSNNLIFMGRTVGGKAKDENEWLIKKFIYDVNNNLLDILWANGNGCFDKTWDDRLTFEYS